MVKRQCFKCKAIFNQKGHYDYHINRKTDCVPNGKYENDVNNKNNTSSNDVVLCGFVQSLSDNTHNEKNIIKTNLINTIDKDDLAINQNNITFSCCYCHKNYSSKSVLTRHLKDNCSVKKENNKETENIFKLSLDKDKQKDIEINELKKQNKLLMDKIDGMMTKNNEIIKIHKSIKKLETNIPANTNLTISNQFIEKLIQKDKEIEKLTIKQIPKKVNKIIDEDDEFDKLVAELENDIINNNINNEIVNDVIIEDNEPMTLILNNDAIECRKTDGYINATQLCKAGNKLFGHWYTLESTKKLISSLESNIGIPILNLVEKNIGGNHSSTWVHPDLAIQLAQWLSPEFALQVSHWIRTLFVKGKVEVNIKLLKEQENIIKTCKSRIKHLEDRILKRQPRPKYDNSKFVVYLATNKKSMKDRLYTVGLARDLSERISNYNKMEDHFPIYYKAFMDEEQMKVAESMVLNKLYDYREKESRDRFILPVGKDIKLFTKAIDDTLNFFNN